MLNKKTFLKYLLEKVLLNQNKNTIIFLGKPLISWTIEAAKI